MAATPFILRGKGVVFGVPKVPPPIPTAKGVGKTWHSLWEHNNNVVGICCLEKSGVLDVVFSNKAGAGGAAVEVEMEMALCQRTILILDVIVLTLKMAK